ncbi:hypothetical protein F4679DRAFT_590216 [Xylaria curta]|nr:hypothetical protein F4679DRAFT_590216 [Xylaria curta]
MKITISVLPILAAVLASASASPVGVDTGPITPAPVFSPATTTTEVAVTPMHYPDPDKVRLVGIDNPDGWAFEVWKHGDPKKDKECQHDACQECVHHCGDLRGYACIHFKCMPKVCRNCNLVIVRPPSIMDALGDEPICYEEIEESSTRKSTRKSSTHASKATSKATPKATSKATSRATSRL